MDSKIFLGKYRVAPEKIEAVGQAADSILTYAAQEIDSGKKVVVEVVPATSLNAAARERLEAQAMAAKTLNHVNIADLYDFGVQDHHLVYVSDDFEGTTAEEWVNANGPMPVGPVLRIASQVMSALSAAAFHGIVHRAISPSNLVLVPGQTAQGEWPLVKVLHFVGGAPKIPGSDVGVAAFDKSTHYASPEQRERGTVDFRSEIYSLGCTMWFLLSGAPPLMTPDGPRPPTKTALPKKVGDLLDQMLSANPEARSPDPFAFYRKLQDCLSEAERRDTTVRASRTPAPRSGVIDAPRSRRFPLKSLVGAAACLAVAAVAALVARGYLNSTKTTASIAPLPTPVVVDTNTRSITTDSGESFSTKQITAVPLLTTSDPQVSPPQETRPVVPNNASDPPAAIDSSKVAAAPQVEIVPAPAKLRDEVSAVVLSAPKEIKMPEVRRAEPADEPEVRRAELVLADKAPRKRRLPASKRSPERKRGRAATSRQRRRSPRLSS